MREELIMELIHTIIDTQIEHVYDDKRRATVGDVRKKFILLPKTAWKKIVAMAEEIKDY